MNMNTSFVSARGSNHLNFNLETSILDSNKQTLSNRDRINLSAISMQKFDDEC